MDTKQNLTILRDIFYKSFFIGLFFLVVAALLYMPCKCFLAELYQTGFGIRTEAYYNMWVGFMGLIKTILIFLFLTPAIAIHWVCKVYEKKHKTFD